MRPYRQLHHEAASSIKRGEASPPALRRAWLQARTSACFLAALALILSSPVRASAQAAVEASAGRQDATEEDSSARVLGLKYNCVHVLKLEETLKLYREILGFRLAGAEVLHGEGIEGMLVLKVRANDCTICLSLPSPDHRKIVGPIGNTNHNHFMLLVNDIVPICDRLKKEGYALENEAYARDKYSFFTGPNGEIIGLTEYRE